MRLGLQSATLYSAMLGWTLALSACGGATRDEGLTQLFASEEADVARRRAPDLFAQADSARAAAADASTRNREAAEDHRTRARLLLAAAFAEVDRLELEERRLELEAQEHTLRATLHELQEHNRERIEAQRRELAAQLARDQASRVFEQASEDESRLFPGRSNRGGLHQEGARFLIERARFTLVAARALGATQAEAVTTRAAIERATQTRAPAQAIQAANEAYVAANRLLGLIRRRTPSIDDDPRTLIADARQRGLAAEQLDEGVLVQVANVFPGRGTRPERQPMTAMAALIAAHPSGPVLIRVGHSDEPSAQRRATALREALIASGIPADRITTDSTTEPETVSVIFLGYAPR